MHCTYQKKKKERERMHCIILKLANFFKAIHLLYLYVLLSWVGPEQFLEESRAELTDTK